MIKKFTAAFPWIVSLFTFLSLVYPPIFTWFEGPFITFGLGGIMLGMGLTLKGKDFVAIVQHPRWVFLGLGMQFLVMPLLGWSLAQVFQLPPLFAVGMILVASCPGGTASNVIAYLAKAEVALSVTMTACSTLAAIFMTPFLTLQLSGSYLEIPAEGLFFSTLKVVLLPITLGVLANRYLPKITRKIIPYAPPIAVLLICLIVASIVGQGKEIILSSGIRLLLALLCLHLLGFILGFIVSLGLLKNWNVAKTISIEVGMQNSGLGVVLARENFSSPVVAIPAALSSLIHSLLGSFFVHLFKDKE
ncbi:bile acid:sodium symporter family protein [Flavobacteriaceae bacterium]|nr:bile acid:sodium symporter family protein [Flavobacteriaceae bacterium]MDA9016263.1 bile acid:sodium symporter family protein [Flavobacteriaceae bacterium]MDB3862990.1 bile acid:sodium symporter family protein [Flavobacteriaceae bacterium]